ncbi:MAG: ABC transporter ATP-binding protein [Firmicutes bacterium]|nr:ABC transporter ATP-binding protein [Bacillota bacterium]
MMLQVENGCYSYVKGNPVLHNITFSLKSGKILTVMGPNGIGKTTLLKCIMGILKWQSGYSLVNGQDSLKVKKQIGYVPQAHSFSFPYLVRDMVVFGRAKYMSAFATPSHEDYVKAEAALQEVGMLDLKDKSCSQLSGGQLQLVLIARALAGEPKLLIMDEPESHLDFSNQLTILKIIKRLAKEKEIGCIMNTHYPNNAIQIADQTLLLKEGKYIVGHTSKVLSRENIQEFFAVDSEIVNIQINGEQIDAFIILEKI